MFRKISCIVLLLTLCCMAKAQQVKTFSVNGVEWNMVLVEAGQFTMGEEAPAETNAKKKKKQPVNNAVPAHQVTLTKNYWLGQTEVTQALWQTVMDTNPSKTPGDNLPVGEVSYIMAQQFLQRLNELTGLNFRLPTEAEWEFAARGGTKSQGYSQSGSNNLSEVAWWCGNASDNEPRAVATKKANELGLYDMQGNVLELCSDFFGPYTAEPQTDPQGTPSGTTYVVRGGSCGHTAMGCKTTFRVGHEPMEKYGTGLRLALTAADGEEEENVPVPQQQVFHSPDLSFFDLHGHVKKCTWHTRDYEDANIYTATFDRKGVCTSYTITGDGATYDMFTHLVRDSEKRIVEYGFCEPDFVTDEIYPNVLRWNKDNTVSSEAESNGYPEGFQTFKHTYSGPDADGIYTLTQTEIVPDGDVWGGKRTYEIQRWDAYKNWLTRKQTTHADGETSPNVETVVRTITYYE